MTASTALATYQSMRDFAQTPEPRGEPATDASAGHSFVVQKHAARSLHYDFRLELDGTLKSWAVPKGPSLDASVKRMAVQVEDHPVSYGGFEGTIPEGHYGAGTVIVWDRGSWSPIGDARAGLAAGHLKFDLDGEKLHGRWALVRMKPRAGERQPAWLLIKERDAAAREASEFDVVVAEPDSVLTPAKRPAAPSGRPKPATGAVRPAKVAPTMPKTSAAALPAAPVRKAKASTPNDSWFGGVRVTHPERVIDPQSGVSKGELVAFYDSVAALMLPHLKDRPVALVRAPSGVGGPQFFQKHVDAGEIDGIRLLDPALDPAHEALIAVASARGLLSAAQLNVVEFHGWNMVSRSMPHADRMLFDLDPGAGVEWPAIRDAAEVLHTFLTDIGLTSRLKTSGGKGLHVVVPLAPRHDWRLVRQFSEAIVERLAATAPERFVDKSGPRNRVGKIYIDYLRNGWGATVASAWSARARPGLGVSVPVGWDELAQIHGGAHWTVRNIEARLSIGNAPWAALGTSRQTLAKAMKALQFEPRTEV